MLGIVRQFSCCFVVLVCESKSKILKNIPKNEIAPQFECKPKTTFFMITTFLSDGSYYCLS